MLHLRLRNMPILQMLRMEEALFRADRRSWFITNRWDAGITVPEAVAVVLGISGKPEVMVDRQRAHGLPLIKRFSGGGTVVVDEDTLFATFIAGAETLPEVQPYPKPILEWTGEVYADALRRCGESSFAVRENDYCLGDLKFGGNAQSISGRRWLHHTSLLWAFAPERMAALRMPPRQPAYRAERAHNQFVRGLSEALPSREGFLDALTAATGDRLPLQSVGLEETHEALRTAHRQVTKLLPGHDPL